MEDLQVSRIVLKVRSYLNKGQTEWQIIGPFFMQKHDRSVIEGHIRKNFTYTFHVEVLDVEMYDEDNELISDATPYDLIQGL